MSETRPSLRAAAAPAVRCRQGSRRFSRTGCHLGTWDSLSVGLLHSPLLAGSLFAPLVHGPTWPPQPFTYPVSCPTTQFLLDPNPRRETMAGLAPPACKHWVPYVGCSAQGVRAVPGSQGCRQVVSSEGHGSRCQSPDGESKREATQCTEMPLQGGDLPLCWRSCISSNCRIWVLLITFHR